MTNKSDPRADTLDGPASAPAASRRTSVLAAVIVLAVVLAAAFGIATLTSGDRAGDVAEGVPSGAPGMGEGIVIHGPAEPTDELPTLDIYSDPQCPYCAIAEQQYGPTVAQLGEAGEVRVVFHLRNSLDERRQNHWSTRAANAMACAADAGRFGEYTALLYSAANYPHDPNSWSDAFLDRTAVQAGVEGEAKQNWDLCAGGGRYVEYVNSVDRQSRADGVSGTPTYRIDGRDFAFTETATPQTLIDAVRGAAS